MTFWIEQLVNALDIVAALTLIATISWNWRKIEPKFKVFIFYAINSFLYLTVVVVLKKLLDTATERSIYSNSIDILFSTIELFTFSIFFGKTFGSTRFKNVSRFICIVFFGIGSCIVLSGLDTNLSNSDRNHLSDLYFGAETMTLSAMAIYYYFWLFRQPIISRIEEDPSFRIITGVFFYSLFMASFFFVSEFIRKTNGPLFQLFYSLHLTMFGGLLLTISWACRKSKIIPNLAKDTHEQSRDLRKA